MRQQTLWSLPGWKDEPVDTKPPPSKLESEPVKATDPKPPVPWAESSFAKLSKEIRHYIYRLYYEVPGGYVVNPSSNKLITAEEEPIDLSLELVCIELRAETKGLAFQVNAVHAATTPLASEFPMMAARWDNAVRTSHMIDQEVLLAARSLVAGPIYDHVMESHPYHIEGLDNLLLNNRYTHPYGTLLGATQGPTAERKFLHHTLNNLRHFHDFRTTIDADLLKRYTASRLDDASNLDFWHISDQPQRPLDASTKYCYSAAAVMIGFLRRYLFYPVFMAIREIYLDEDRASAAFPESHGDPFVDFLSANPNLKVHRRVSLWYSVYASIHDTPFRHPHNAFALAILRWIKEADNVIVRSQGSRDEAVYSLEFDCDGMPLLARGILNMIQKEAAWQTARAAMLKEDIRRGIHYTKNRHSRYLWDSYGELEFELDKMSSNLSPIFCDFDFDFGVNIQQRDFARADVTWDQRKWKQFYDERKTFMKRLSVLWKSGFAGEDLHHPFNVD